MIKSIKQANLKDKRIVMRVDFNVPVKKGKVLEDFKIDRVLPTIKYLLKNNNKLILISHFGRPEGRRVKAMSLKPVYRVLKKKLAGKKVKFADSMSDIVYGDALSDITFLENIRYDKREEKNDLRLARELAKLGDVFVNEAFSFAHRKTSSSVGIAKYLPSYAGLNFMEEFKYLSKALKPKKPAVAMIGGAKIKTKFDVLENFLRSYSKILVAGGIANTFLLASGYEIGRSIVEPSKVRKAKQLLRSRKIVMPVDFVVADKNLKNARIVKVGDDKKLCRKTDYLVDLGPETIELFLDQIWKAQTIVWGGPPGLIENKEFSRGTVKLARAIGQHAVGRPIAIAGGGETVMAIEMAKSAKKYDFISTGGSAMLEFLEGKKLPGIKALK